MPGVLLWLVAAGQIEPLAPGAPAERILNNYAIAISFIPNSKFDVHAGAYFSSLF